jgi:hypothetical protein
MSEAPAQFDFTRAFRTLQQAFPGPGRGGGALVEGAFVHTLLGEPEGPAATFETMMRNLESQKAGAQFKRGYVPSMLNWLRAGRWMEEHDPVTPAAAPAPAAQPWTRLDSIGPSNAMVEEMLAVARAREAQRLPREGGHGRES